MIRVLVLTTLGVLYPEALVVVAAVGFAAWAVTR